MTADVRGIVAITGMVLTMIATIAIVTMTATGAIAIGVMTVTGTIGVTATANIRFFQGDQREFAESLRAGSLSRTFILASD